MKRVAGNPLLRAAFLAACAWVAAAGQESGGPGGKAPSEGPTVHANRVLFHPITSFYINGVNGAYERRFAKGRLGLHVPFYLGRIVIEEINAETTLGGGLGFDLFLSTAASGSRFSATAEWMDLRRQEYGGYGDNFDPTFPGTTQSRYDVYHLYLYSASLTFGYRWEYPSRRFLADLAFGGGFSALRGPGSYPFEENPYGLSSRTSYPPLVLLGLMPVARFALGIPF